MKGIWGLIIICTFIILVIIISLFSIPWPGGGSTNIGSNVCLPNSGFSCRIIYYSNGTATFMFSQNLDKNWQNVEILLIRDNLSYPNITKSTLWNTPNATSIINGLKMGISKQVNMDVSKPVSLGTNTEGWIWAKYQVNSTNDVNYILVAKVYLHAVKNSTII